MANISKTLGNAFKVHAPPVIYGFGRYIYLYNRKTLLKNSAIDLRLASIAYQIDGHQLMSITFSTKPNRKIIVLQGNNWHIIRECIENTRL